MLKFEIGTKDVDKFEMQGHLTEISAEVMMAVGMVYRLLAEKDRNAAESYRFCITEGINDGVPFKTNRELAQDMVKKFMDEVKKDLREADE